MINYCTFSCLYKLLLRGLLTSGNNVCLQVWRLPVLLVNDFAEVTPLLLRQAYIEAVYRADEFQFQRLTQSYWYSFIMRVAKQQRVETILESFPAVEDPTFTRPAVPYSCDAGRCGTGTKHPPAISC